MRGSAVGEGDTTEASTSRDNVERPRLPLVVKDVRTLSDSDICPNPPDSSPSLSKCGGECLLHGKQKSFERNNGGTNSNNCSSSNSDSDMYDNSSVNSSISRIINDSNDTCSSYRCNSNVESSSRRNSHGGTENVGNSVFFFTSLGDSCRSTTVSTPSPAASSTPQSVRSSSLQMDGVCCLISACSSCDICGSHSSTDNAATGESTGSLESDTSLLKWCEVSPAALLGCGSCCAPSPTLSCSSGMHPAAEYAAACRARVCRYNAECRVLKAQGMPEATESAVPDTPTKQPTATNAAGEQDLHQVCITDADEQQVQPKPLPVEELFLPAAVGLTRDVVLRAQQQRQLPRSPSELRASLSIANALLQADSSVTHAAAAGRKGDAAWRCSSSSSWSASASSTCSPSVGSQLPIVPLSAWPVPATYACEEGVLRPQTDMRNKSHDIVDLNSCGRIAELICYNCCNGECKLQETVLHPAVHENRIKDLTHPGRQTADGNYCQHLRRRLHKQPLANFISGVADHSPAELVLPALFKRPAHRSRSATQVFPAPSPAAAQNVITVPVDTDDAAASSQVTISAASPPPSHLRVPLRFPADCSVLSHGARYRALAPSTPSPGASRAEAGFCSSIIRTATLLLGDHDSESTAACVWSMCDSSGVLAQQQQEELYKCDTSTTGDSGCHSSHSATSNRSDGKIVVEGSCNVSSSSGYDALTPSCGPQALEQGSSLQKERAPSPLVATAGTGSRPSTVAAALVACDFTWMARQQSRTIDNVPAPQSKEWLRGQGQPQRQQEYEQQGTVQELQKEDHQCGQEERQTVDAGRAHPVLARKNAQVATRGERRRLTAALDNAGARLSETAIGMAQLRPVTATKDASAAVAQPTRATASQPDQRPGQAEPSEMTVSASGNLLSLQETLPVQPQRPLFKSMPDLNQCHPAVLDPAQRHKAVGTVTGAPGSTTAAPDALALTPSAPAAAGGPSFKDCLVLRAARANREERGRVDSLDSKIPNAASLLNSEASKSDVSTGTEQERRAAANAGTVEEHLQLQQDCVVAPAGIRVLATPPAPRSHRRNKQEAGCTRSGTRHRSTASADSRRWSRSSSRGSVSSTSTQSGLPSHWTSRSSSTRCSPLSSSKGEPLATTAAADEVERIPAAADHCLSAAAPLPSISRCKPVNLPHRELHQAGSTSDPQSLAQYLSREPFFVATPSDMSGARSSAPEDGRAIGLAENPAKTTSVATATPTLHPEQAPPTMLAAACHAAAAPSALAEAAVAASAAPLGTSRAPPAPDKLATAPPLLDSVDTVALPENPIQLQSIQCLDWAPTLRGTGEAPAAAPGVAANPTITLGPSVREAAVESSPAAEAPSKMPHCSKTAATAAFSGLAAAASVSYNCTSLPSNAAALDPLSVLPCDTAATQQHPDTAPFLLAGSATAPKETPTPAEVRATQTLCLPVGSATASTSLTNRIQEAGASFKEEGTQALDQTLWTRQQLTGEAQQPLTQESPHIAAQVAATGKVQPVVSGPLVNHQEPLQLPSQHFRQLLKELPVRQLGSQRSRGRQSVQHIRTAKPPQLHERQHAWCQQHPQELLAPAAEGICHRRSSNTRLAPANYQPRVTDSPTRQKPPAKDSRYPSNSGEKNNGSSKSQSSGAPRTAAEVEALPASAVDAAFTSCSRSAHAALLRRSFPWVSATGDTAASSSISASHKSFHEKTAADSGNNGDSDSRFVKNINCTLNGSCEASCTSACKTFQTSAVETAAASVYTSAASLAATAGPTQEKSSWELPQQQACSTECLYAGSRATSVTGATAFTDVALLPGPVLGRGEQSEVSQQLQHGELQTRCPPARSCQATTSRRPSQDLRVETMSGTIPRADAVTAASGKWASATSHTQTDLAVHQCAAAEVAAHVKAGDELYKEAESFRRTEHRVWVTQQQNKLPDHGASLYLEAAAGGQRSFEGEITVSTSVAAANDDPALSSAARPCPTKKNASLAGSRYSGALGASAFHDAGAAGLPDSPPAASLAAASTSSATTGDTKRGADAELYPAAEDRNDGPEEPAREHLITMSDSRQLRLYPDLRRAAAAIGGGGVRCATTKQLYQLAELCGFDDVLPPEFRRPRSSTEQSETTLAADTPESATDKTAARLVVTEDVRKCRAEKTGSISSAVPLASSKKRPAAGDASEENKSSALSTATPAGAPPRVDNGDLRVCYDIGSCGRSLDSSYLRTTAYTADAGKFQNLRQQPATVIEEKRRQQLQHHLQQQPTAHCMSEKKTHKLRQQTQKRGSAAETVTQVVERDSATWRPLILHQRERRESHELQQHPLQQLHQQQQQPQPPQQYQQRPRHHQQPHRRLEPTQQQCYEQQHQHRLQQQKFPPQQFPPQRDCEAHQARLPVFPHTPQEPVGLSAPCEDSSVAENTAPGQHVQQQSPPLQTRPQRQPQEKPTEEQHFRQQHWPQRNLLPRNLLLPRHEEDLQQLHFQGQQQTAHHQPEQGRVFVGHFHSNADTAVQRAVETTPPRVEASRIETLQAPGGYTESTVEFIGAPEASSAAAVVASATPYATRFSLPSAADSTANNRYSTSRNDNHDSSCCSNNVNGSSWTRKRSTVKLGCWTPGTDHSNFDNGFPPEQHCLLQRGPGRHGDHALQRDHQQLTQQLPSRYAAAMAGGWIALEGGPTRAPDSPAAPPDRDSTATIISGASLEVAPGATGGVGVAGSAAGVVAYRSRRELQQQLCPLAAVAPVEIASAAGHRPRTSTQSCGELGTGSALTCGSCSTTCRRSCLAEDAHAVAAASQETPNKTASPNTEREAPSARSNEGGAPLQMDTSFATATPAATTKKRDFSVAAREKVTCHRDTNVLARQQRWSSQTGIPNKRRRVEAARTTASQERSSLRARSSNNEEQHPARAQCPLDERVVAQQRQQLPKASAATYPRECRQRPIALPQGSQGEQLCKQVLVPQVQDIRVEQPQQRLQLVAEQHEERVHQQCAQQRQGVQQHPRDDGSPRLPSSVSQLSDGVDASRWAFTTNEQLQSPELKSVSDLEAYPQLQHQYETRPQNFNAVRETQRREAYGTSTRSWQEGFYSNTSSTRCTTGQVHNYSNSSASRTWVSVTDTHVVDEFFNMQPQSEIGCSSGRLQMHQDKGGPVAKNCNGVSCRTDSFSGAADKTHE